MIDKNRVKKRFAELKDEGKERIENLKVEGSELAGKVRELVEEGNARKVIIKINGRVMGEFPLAVGIGGAAAAVVLAPTLAAIASIGALASSKVEVLVFRKDNAGTEVAKTVGYEEVDENP